MIWPCELITNACCCEPEAEAAAVTVVLAVEAVEDEEGFNAVTELPPLPLDELVAAVELALFSPFCWTTNWAIQIELMLQISYKIQSIKILSIFTKIWQLKDLAVRCNKANGLLIALGQQTDRYINNLWRSA